MQGIGAGIQWQSRPLIRLAVAIAVVSGIFIVAPPAHAAPDVTVSPTDITGAEKPSAADVGTYDVVLTEIPSGDVTVTVSPNSQVTVDKSPLIFTMANWNVAQEVTVTPVNDAVAEGTHDGVVLHSASGGGYIAGPIDGYTISITDDDDSFDVAFDAPTSSQIEGNGGPTGKLVLVELTTAFPLTAAATVDVSRTSGTATPGVDFSFTSPTTVTFPIGAATGATESVSVSVSGDTTPESDETVVLGLAGGSIGSPSIHTLTIINDDSDSFSVAFSVASSSQIEGNGGPTGKSVLVELTTATPLIAAATVNVSVTGGTATGSDFSFTSPTTVTFPSGSGSGTTRSVSVSVNGDVTPESDETVVLGLAGVSTGGSIVAPNPHTLTITNDDFSVAFGSTTSSRFEGASGTSSAVVTVVLDTGGGLLPGLETVLVGRTGGTATSGSDFAFTSPTTVTFPAGSADGATRTVTVAVNGDTLTEADETLILGLSAVSAGGTIVAPTSHTLTILNDDVDLGLSVLNAAPVAEGPGVTQLKFTVVLNPGSGSTVTVRYSTADGTAKAPGDYTAKGLTTLTFLAGQTTKDVFVTVANDAVDEIAETVLLNLSAPTGSTIADAQGVGTILDDDNVAPVVVEPSLITTDAAGNPGFQFMTGQTVKLTGTFTDPGLADTHIVEVNWGDGKPSVFLPILPVGTRSFESTHVYDAESFFGISVTVSDADPGGKGVMKETFVSVSGESVAEGDHRIGLVDPATGVWRLYDEAGNLATQFFFGNPGDYPFMGDWDGDGIETPGLYRQSDGFVYLTNKNSASVADISFFFGNPGDIPIAGDFNGNGFDTVSIFRPSNQTAFIINELGEDGGGLGAADTAYVIGNPGDKPFVGDFDGNGTETVGLHRESTGLVYFRNAHSAGFANGQFLFGDPGDRLVAGDWTGSGQFNPALFRPAATTMFFRYSNSQGNADFEWSAGESEWLPVSGVTGF